MPVVYQLTVNKDRFVSYLTLLSHLQGKTFTCGELAKMEKEFIVIYSKGLPPDFTGNKRKL
jgi:hypothetical protein